MVIRIRIGKFVVMAVQLPNHRSVLTAEGAGGEERSSSEESEGSVGQQSVVADGHAQTVTQ